MKNKRYYGRGLFFFFALFLIETLNSAYAQNLLQERIRKITPRKKSVYLGEGIFHKGGDEIKGLLNAMRHSYSQKIGYERIVFDFDGENVPKIYGNISEKDKKLYIDMFNTSVNPAIPSLGKSYLVKSLLFYPIDENSLSLEIELNSPGKFDIFYLTKPGRLVVDLKI